MNKEGWILFDFLEKIDNKEKKQLFKAVQKCGGRIASETDSTACIYLPKCFGLYGMFDMESNNLLYKRIFGHAWTWKTFYVKPWEIMTDEEKEEDRNLEGRVFTSQRVYNNGSKTGQALLVSSRLERKKTNIPPMYECFLMRSLETHTGFNPYSGRKVQMNSRDIRKDRTENDLSFLVQFGAPGQIVIDKINEKVEKLEKQLNGWKKTLEKLEER